MFLSQFDICQGRTEQRLKLAGKLPDKQTLQEARLGQARPGSAGREIGFKVPPSFTGAETGPDCDVR